MGKEVIMESPWLLKLHFWQIAADSESLSAIESSLDGWKNGKETILVVGAYAPTEDSDECVRDDFYDGL